MTDRYQPLRDAIATRHTSGGLVFGADPDTIAALLADNDRLREALTVIEGWRLPETGKCWPSGEPISYTSNYGSNGARDYMRSVARAALADGEMQA